MAQPREVLSSHPESKVFGMAEKRDGPFGNFDVLNNAEFLDDFQNVASRTASRLWVKAMLIARHTSPTTIQDQMIENAQRGVSVKAHSDFVFSKSKENDPMFDRMREQGVEVVFTNRPKDPKGIQRLLPKKITQFIGRDHRKIILTDDIAYLGGLNVCNFNYKAADFMVKITDPTIVEQLARQFDRVNENHPPEDFEVKCNDETSIIVDSGKPGVSKILDAAISLVENADYVEAMLQFIPEGKFLEALRGAYLRRANIHVITSRPDSLCGLPSTFDEFKLVLLDLQNKLPPVISFYPDVVHAKMLVTRDRNSGVKTTIIGSHNFSDSSVKYGTTELSLITTNRQLIGNLEEFFASLQKSC